MAIEPKVQRSLKYAKIAPFAGETGLELTWSVSTLVCEPNRPALFGGDTGFAEIPKSTQEVEYVLWSKRLYDAYHSAGDRLLAEDEVRRILDQG